MKFLAIASLVASTCMATTAFAAGQGGPWYTGVSGDVSFPDNTSVTGTTNGNLKYKFSSGGNVALGYEPQALSNSTGDVRLEVEGGYHALGLKDITAGGVTNTNPGKDLKAETLMGNAYYDLHTGTRFTPYVGVGVGGAHVTLDKNSGFGMTKGSDNEFAYQLMTGVSYTPESIPNTDWTLGYRYLGTESPQFATSTGNVKLDAIHDSSIEVGVKYHF